MSIFNPIQLAPMQFPTVSFSPALSGNPENAKAAQYGGSGGNQPAVGGATSPSGQQAQPAAGQGPDGIMALIRKLLGGNQVMSGMGSAGGGMADIGSLIAGLGA